MCLECIEHEELVFYYDEYIKGSKAAWFLEIANKKHWLSKKQCVIDMSNKCIYVPEWLAIKKSLV